MTASGKRLPSMSLSSSETVADCSTLSSTAWTVAQRAMHVERWASDRDNSTVDTSVFAPRPVVNRPAPNILLAASAPPPSPAAGTIQSGQGAKNVSKRPSSIV